MAARTAPRAQSPPPALVCGLECPRAAEYLLSCQDDAEYTDPFMVYTNTKRPVYGPSDAYWAK